MPATTLVWRTLRFTEGETNEPAHVVRYTVRDASDRIIVEDMVLKSGKATAFELELGLDAGAYRFIGCTDTLRRCEASLELRAPTPEPIELRLE